MDIMTVNGSFGVGMMRMGDWEPVWNKKDRSLTIKGKRDYPLSVTTSRGIFLECVDTKGTILMDGGDGDWFYVPAGDSIVTLRYKKLAHPKLSKPDIEKARKKTTITVVNQERYDSGPFEFGASFTDGTLTKVIKSLESIRNGIPKEYRAKARCEIDSESGYEGSHYAHIEVAYERPETDQEVIGRVKTERERARIQENKERAQLAALQNKLGKTAIKTDGTRSLAVHGRGG